VTATPADRAADAPTDRAFQAAFGRWRREQYLAWQTRVTPDVAGDPMPATAIDVVVGPSCEPGPR
jgi:hypothetical protein